MSNSLIERQVIDLFESLEISSDNVVCPVSEGLAIIYENVKKISIPAISSCDIGRVTSVSVCSAIESGMTISDFSKIFNMGWYIDEDNELSFDIK